MTGGPHPTAPHATTWRRDALHRRGTRFRLYPQAPLSPGSPPPEVVWVSSPAGSLGPGPSDTRMYAVDAIGKAMPYDPPDLPPWRGPANPPVMPGPDGHFDHLPPGSRAFMTAHMFGTVRLVLDIWERYLGDEVRWHFSPPLERLELVPLVEWDNAQCGFGFIETGYATLGNRRAHPFCLDFDVLAHELGHALIYGLLGIPPDDRVTTEYLSFHESAADCSAIIAVLHFDSVVDRLLVASHGNLYLPNELNRIGELSETEQLRNASNYLTMADVPDPKTPVDDLSQKDRHTVGLPLTGGVFDLLVEVFQDLLVEEGFISRALDDLSRQEKDPPQAAVQAGFDRAYAGRHDAFKAALLDARDYVGRLIAGTWLRLGWDVTFDGVAEAMLDADLEMTGGRGRTLILENLAWRGLLPRAPAAPPGPQRVWAERIW